MRCPYCYTDHDKVVDTRAMGDGYEVRRRRECIECGKRFTTAEKIDRRPIRVTKRDGSCQPYDPQKIRNGIERACWKRAVKEEAISETVLRIENEIREEYENEISSQQIGGIVLQNLIDLDEVALIRFASVYQNFNNAEDFIRKISPQSIEARMR